MLLRGDLKSSKKMFKRKLAALGFHHPDDFNANGNYIGPSKYQSDCILFFLSRVYTF